jgi:hypothetical protein
VGKFVRLPCRRDRDVAFCLRQPRRSLANPEHFPDAGNAHGLAFPDSLNIASSHQQAGCEWDRANH